MESMSTQLLISICSTVNKELQGFSYWGIKRQE